MPAPPSRSVETFTASEFGLASLPVMLENALIETIQ
jgi:hypothetical protein